MNQRFGPILSRLLIIMPMICAVSAILSYGAWLEAASVREISTYDHIIARVENTHMARPPRGKAYQVSDIAFSTQKDDEIIRCRSEQPTNGLKPGDTVNVIVQPGTCNIPLIVSGTPSYFVGFTIAFGITAAISFVLSVLVVIYARRYKIGLWSEHHKVEWS